MKVFKGICMMKNVLDIKREKNLNFILPQKTCLYAPPIMDKNKTVVIIHLHYAEKLYKYFSYFLSIPLEVDVLFTTLEQKIIEMLKSYQKNKTTV